MQRDKYLSNHPYSVWQDKQGKWCTYLPKEGHRSNRMLYKRKTKEELEDLIVQYWRDKEENPTLREIFDDYNKHREEIKRVQPSTILRDTKRFERYYSDFGNQRILDLTPRDIQDFLEKLVAKWGLTAKEFSNVKGITKGFLKRAKRLGLITWDISLIMDDLDINECQFRQSVREDSEEVYYDDEMDMILEYCKAHPIPLNLGIALIFVTGIRVGELATLMRDDFEGLTFKVKRTETRYVGADGKDVFDIKEFPKTRAGYRTVVIPEQFEWIIKKAKTVQPFLPFMFNNRRGERLKGFSYRHQLRRITSRLGIPYRSPHKIRKTYCSILLDNKLDNKLIEKQVGHVDISVTENRYHRDRRYLTDKIKIFSDIPQFSGIDKAGSA